MLASSLSSYAIIAGILGAWRKDEGLLKSGRNATISVFACLTVAMIVLLTLLIKSDFSVLYVAEHTARNLPLAYKISALWAGSAGSLLLWLWIQVGFVVWIYCTGSDGRGAFASRARGIANFVSVFFLLIMIWDKNPFAPAETLVTDGFGLNPLLQHPAMVLHPPLLFVGYAGFVIPFAWTFAWLRYRGLGPVPLLTKARNCTLVAWLFLTIGIVLGAWWAYEELGWGGYWAWDPVENSSLMPWLTSTALLHCFRVYKDRGGIAVWTMILSLLTFSLCVFGRFLTKYGLVSSVHAFGDPGLGIVYIVLLAHVWVIATVLIIRKFFGKAKITLEPPLKSHRFIVWGNWILLLLTGLIFIGTLFPFITEMFGKLTVALSLKDSAAPPVTLDPSFFTKITSPAGMLLLLLIGVCPHMFRYGVDKSWRIVLGVLSIIAACAMWLVSCSLDIPRPAGMQAISWFAQWLLSGSAAVPCFILSGLMIVNLVADVIGYERKNAGRKQASRKFHWYGARIVHLGVALMFIGIAGSGGFGGEKTEAMRPGDKVAFHGYELAYDDMGAGHGDNYMSVVANISIYRDGELITKLKPAQAIYTGRKDSYSEIDVRRTLGGDLYLALTGYNVSSKVINLRIMIKPLINWIWLGCCVICIGAAMILFVLCLPGKVDLQDLGRDGQ